MRIHILSDLHLEFSHYQPHRDADAADVIILAGDISKSHHGIFWARAAWPDKKIVYVAGNHEFYGRDRKEVLSRLRIAARETGVHFLDNDEFIIDGVRFLGATLWTDFALFGEEDRRGCMAMGQRNLSDFRVIHEGQSHFSPMDSVNLHQESVSWLEMKLKGEPFDGKTVVVTHHLPSQRSVAERFLDDELSACFASHLDHLLGSSALWIHGHTHDSFDYSVAGTRVICNPRGYCRYESSQENADFDPVLIVEV